jgi:hypothetical protein
LPLRSADGIIRQILNHRKPFTMRQPPPARARRPLSRAAPRRRSCRLAIWSLAVTLLILAWMLVPYIPRW